jgi:hypothetical protein
MNWRPSWDMATVPDEVFWAEWSRRVALKRDGPPRAKVLRPCPYCSRNFGARELRLHIPTCQKKRK